MIRVYRKMNDKKDNTGFYIEGHAGYRKAGEDIVCAAVSVLAINCINSIEVFTKAKFQKKEDEGKGIIDFEITDDVIPEGTKLLLLSFFYGIHEIQNEYGTKYVELINQ
jgi:uncharacterized protein YsxB (DUF464 family)